MGIDVYNRLLTIRPLLVIKVYCLPFLNLNFVTYTFYRIYLIFSFIKIRKILFLFTKWKIQGFLWGINGKLSINYSNRLEENSERRKMWLENSLFAAALRDFINAPPLSSHYHTRRRTHTPTHPPIHPTTKHTGCNLPTTTKEKIGGTITIGDQRNEIRRKKRNNQHMLIFLLLLLLTIKLFCTVCQKNLHFIFFKEEIIICIR